ncbi:MAG: hypothetical protein U0Y68_17995 [Blastocatellia bacterium]
MENVAQKNLVRRYLLGDLPEREQLQLEQAYFANSEMFEQVWDWENELVDSYVRGQLPKQERDLFERHYLTTLKHQQRVAVARNLVQAADATLPREAITDAAPSWWTNLLAFFSGPQLAWGGALALLLLTLGGWWYFRPSAAEQIAQKTPSVQPSASDSPILAIPAPATSPVASPAPSVSPAAQPAVPAVLAFTLGGALRKAGDVQPIVILHGTKQVRLQIPLDGEDYPNYQIKLRSAGGASVLNQNLLRPAPNKKVVAVLLPANKLSPGDYVLTLSGVTSANETEELQQHLFRVTYK